MFRDEKFTSKMSALEKNAWLSFRQVSENFLGNPKSPNYKELVEELASNFQKMKCLMNFKLHLLDSHLDYFPENLGDYSEEQGERFHQDLKEIERRYQGRWDVNMMADYCWLLKRETVETGKERSRQPSHRTFESKRKRYHRSESGY